MDVSNSEDANNQIMKLQDELQQIQTQVSRQRSKGSSPGSNKEEGPFKPHAQYTFQQSYQSREESPQRKITLQPIEQNIKEMKYQSKMMELLLQRGKKV